MSASNLKQRSTVENAWNSYQIPGKDSVDSEGRRPKWLRQESFFCRPRNRELPPLALMSTGHELQ